MAGPRLSTAYLRAFVTASPQNLCCPQEGVRASGLAATVFYSGARPRRDVGCLKGERWLGVASSQR